MKIHIVKQGDTLYLIAKKYNVPLEDIIKANPEISNPDAIEVGMKVKISTQPKTAFEIIHHHIVQQGDSLWKLSKAWGIQLADLIKANPQLKNPNALLTGETVNIPKTPNVNGSPTMQGSSIPNKANTGLIPGLGMKAETGVQPIPLPLPVPPNVPVVPPPAPVMPMQETNPMYGFEVNESMDLFKQYPVPMVQAAAPAEMPYYHEPLSYGYGMQQHVVSPENASVGYGHGYGYGQPQGISPLEGNFAGNLGGLYGYNDMTYSPPDHPASIQEYTSPVLMTVPKTTSGCKTCGRPSAWPMSLYANASANPYANASMNPYANASVNPYANASAFPNVSASAFPNAEMYPGMGYPVSNIPYGVSPYAMGPYENTPQLVSPYGYNPGMQYGPYYGTTMENIPLGVGPMAEAIPGIGYDPHCEPYYGGFPPIPQLPPLPPMPPLRPLRVNDDERSAFSEGTIGEGDITIKASSDKKRQAKPKPKQGASRQIKPKSKESLPWIKW